MLNTLSVSLKQAQTVPPHPFLQEKLTCSNFSNMQGELAAEKHS